MNKILYSSIRFLLVAVIFLASCKGVETPLPAPTQPAAATSTLAPVQSPTTAPTSQPPAAIFRGSPAGRGDFGILTGLTEWSFATGGRILSSPAVDVSGAYFGSMDGHFYAVDLETGREKWKFKTEGEVWGSPTLYDGAVYFGSSAGNFYALDQQTGQEMWKYKTGGMIISIPAIQGDKVYFGNLDGVFYALDMKTGEEKWHFQTGGEIISSPAIAGESIIFGSADSMLYALDPSSGEKQWSFTADGGIESSPTIVNGLIYFGSLSGSFFAVDLETHRQVWRFSANGEIISSPVVQDRVVYFGSLDGDFYALEASSGQEKWRFSTQDGVISSPAIAEGVVYFGSQNGRFYAVEGSSGKEIWSFQTQGEIWSSPAVAGEFVYFGSYDNHLYALRSGSPQLALAPTPTPWPLQPTPTLLPEPGEPAATTSDGLPWWNDRVFYEVFVRSFSDSDGDGIGDLQGLIDKLDYLNDGNRATDQDLGVTGIWLMPVAESPSYHGYDTVDYKQVERDYGTNEELKTLVAEAHERGMVVITDLVMNHTSNQHPWFIDAQSPGSEHENWYIWQNERQDYASPWGSPVWYKSGLRYYYALFWEGMPDLNYNNGAVTAAMFDIIRFWIEDMGVDGFRLDAVRHLIEDGPVQENTPATHNWLQNYHRHVHSLNPQAFTVGEAWTETSEVVKYVGDEVDIAFEFDLAQGMLESILSSSNHRVASAQANVLESFPKGQYGAFLSNHDQNRVMSQLLNDREAAKAAATLLLTNPGVPFIYYGEEIGMSGEKPDERIRTPMQWDGSPAAGFTTATPWQELAGGYSRINVALETADPDSLLNHYRKLIRLRQDHPALRAGEMQLAASDSRKVYSFIRYTDQEIILVLVNLSKETVGDYHLSLEQGPLSANPGVQLLMGEGTPAAPQVNASGGFDAYTPLPALPPHSSTVILLR